MEGNHEIARTARTAALSEHARKTEIYSGKISDCQRPPDNTASNNNMFSGNAGTGGDFDGHIGGSDTGGDFDGHIGGSSLCARCSLASSEAAAECWEVDTKQSQDLSVPVTDTDVQEIL
jgi:hypothetical protein